MNDLISFISANHTDGLIYVAMLLIASVVIIKNWSYIIEKFGIKTQHMIREENQQNNINMLKEHAHKTDENIDKIIGSIEAIHTSLDSLSKQVQKMQEKNDAADRSALRDRIGQSYRYYNQRKKWTRLEKEAFDGLIQSYENAGGLNGMVHQVCIPASLTWEIIDD